MKSLILALAVLLLAAGTFEITAQNFAPSFERCANGYSNEHADEKRTQKDLVVPDVVVARSICSARFIDRHNGVVAAIAGAIVALFTGVLWVATVGLWKSGERQHAISNRAFVHLDRFETEITVRAEMKNPEDPAEIVTDGAGKAIDPELQVTRFAVHPVWKNSGNTPTKNMRVWVNFSPPGRDRAPFYSLPETPIFIAPNSTEYGELIDLGAGNANALINGGQDHIGLAPLFLIWGKAIYEDVFGKTHFVEWRYRIRLKRPNPKLPLGAIYIQTGNYNRTDQDGELTDTPHITS